MRENPGTEGSIYRPSRGSCEGGEVRRHEKVGVVLRPGTIRIWFHRRGGGGRALKNPGTWQNGSSQKEKSSVSRVGLCLPSTFVDLTSVTSIQVI